VKAMRTKSKIELILKEEIGAISRYFHGLNPTSKVADLSHTTWNLFYRKIVAKAIQIPMLSTGKKLQRGLQVLAQLKK
jgi:hypothetical protein